MTQPKQLDVRVLFEDVEIRKVKGENGLDMLQGLACPYEKYSQLLYGMYYEILRKNTFTDCLRSSPDIKSYIDHDTGKVLGRTKNKTLTCTESERGVDFSLLVPDTTYGVDLLKSVDRGDTDGVSIGFRAEDYTWDMYNNYELRNVTKGILREVSIVSNPAYLDTEVYMRSMQDMIKEHKDAMRKHITDMNDILKRKLDLSMLG